MPEKRIYCTGHKSHIEGDKWLLKISAGKKIGGGRNRPQKTIHAKSDKDAERQLQKFIAEYERKYSKERLTVNGLVDLFVENHLPGLAQSTQRWYLDTLRRVRGGLGHIPLEELKPMQIEHFYKIMANPKAKALYREEVREKDGSTRIVELGNGLGGEYRLHHHRVLSAVLNWGYRNDLMDRKIIDRVTPPTSDTEEKRALTEEEIKALLSGLKRRSLKWRTFFTLALVSGMRREELCALEWKHIDIKDRTIKIEQAMQHIRSNIDVLGPAKNDTSNRIIEVPAEMIELIKQWRTEQLQQRMKWPEAWDDEHQFIFTEFHGGAVKTDTCTSRAREIFDKLGIEDVSLHNLRHTCATRMLAAGVPVNDVAAHLGHASPKMTLDRYGHAAEGYRTKCAEVGKAMFQLQK